MLVHEALGYDRFGKRYVTAEEVAARRKRVLNRSDYTFASSDETSEPVHREHHYKMRKEMRENISHKIKVMTLYLIALGAIFSLNCNKKTKLSMAIPLAIVTTFALPFKKDVKGRQRS